MLISCQQDATVANQDQELSLRMQECDFALIAVTSVGEPCIACDNEMPPDPGQPELAEVLQGNPTEGVMVTFVPGNIRIPTTLLISDAFSPHHMPPCVIEVEITTNEERTLCLPTRGFNVHDSNGEKGNCQFVPVR